MGNFQPNLVFLEANFPTGMKFSDRRKIAPRCLSPARRHALCRISLYTQSCTTVIQQVTQLVVQQVPAMELALQPP